MTEFNSPDNKPQKGLVQYMAYWLAFFCLGAVFFLLQGGSLHLTYDSHDYIAASESVSNYFLGKNPDGITYLHRPPLLPAYLYFFENKISAAVWLNLISFATSLFLCFRIGESLRLTKFFLYSALTAIAFGYPWLQNHFFLWTESFFTVFVLLIVYFLIERKKLGIVVLLCVVMFMLRKAGIFIWAGVVIWYLMQKNLRHAFVAGISMIVVFVLWELVVYNFSDVSTSMNIISYLGPLSRTHYADALSSWWIPRMVPTIWRVMSVIVGVGIALFFYYASVRSFIQDSANQVILIIVLVYIAAFVLVFGVPDYHEAERYVSVMLPMTTLAVLSFFNHASGSSSPQSQKVLKLCIMLWCLYPVSRTVAHFLDPIAGL